jgi:hypothetical protein
MFIPTGRKDSHGQAQVHSPATAWVGTFERMYRCNLLVGMGRSAFRFVVLRYLAIQASGLGLGSHLTQNRRDL